jgi:hypothetical protein
MQCHDEVMETGERKEKLRDVHWFSGDSMGSNVKSARSITVEALF